MASQQLKLMDDVSPSIKARASYPFMLNPDANILAVSLPAIAHS